MPTLRYGKFKGEDLRDVPSEYLEFLLDSAESTVVEVRQELDRRRLQEEASLSWIERIVESGYRSLARHHHPDAGGDGEDMKQLNAAVEVLRQVVLDR